MDKIKFYGTRGSYSLTSNKYMEFGGATTCLILNLGNIHIMVDCGSGINNALDDLKEIDELYLFISHSHLDHINGIPTLLSNFGNKKLHILGKAFSDVSIKEAIDKIMNKSLWPIRATTYQNVDFIDINDIPIDINGIEVSNMDSNHPGGCSLFKFKYEKDVIVTAFDFCHLNGYEEKLKSFAEGVTTLIYDGFLTTEELKEKFDWGHSTPDDGARIGDDLGSKETIITHFGVFDDDELYKWEKKLKIKYPNVIFAKSGNKSDDLKRMIEIGTMLSSEKDNDVLLTKIVESSMDITNADGGTLYLLENGKLEFKVLINRSQNAKLVRKEAPLSIPSVPIEAKNICAESARNKRLINIPDCYQEKAFDFSGVIKYDALNNYHTKSVIVIPLIDDSDDVVGVLQIINALDNNKNIIPFTKDQEDILFAIANQATMAIVNSTYSQQINDLLYGFVKVMSVEIDERTPYNANHTRNMVKFAEKFFDYEEKNNGKFNVEYKKRREILMSIWLHDIGKILTPIDIMNKDSRLGGLLSNVEQRFERRELLLKLDLAKQNISIDKYNDLENERVEQLELIRLINNVGYLNDELKTQLDALSKATYIELDGSYKNVINNDEYYALSTVKGTLTFEERLIMQGHVAMTQKFLSQLDFPKNYNNIPSYAGNHHEFLDGSGYPNHLKKDDLPWECRLITICDIFEALIASDRPYKKPMTVEKALSILYEMAEQGKLDKEIINEFELAEPWR